ncbi:NUDIX domain-containing protein [Zeaxanthinibacter enoshimensis]|uniref:GDP-mannose pyrophosphatase n=1 Tax=Zeaxanthinibacter enoshimensis TaxID=392009 RepID=A0A4R6TMR4_9FLAO|nr:NUDIX domain-containing protein [Zeaxanthinibacter enoshimensis]TDQ29381.1 nudix-type nucleoside diphosphatase (YffH/AdpP family) [Zeaxanthinibacter enoshimensis]
MRNVQTEILSDGWSRLSRFTFEYLKDDGQWEEQKREVYDRGDGAVILLYNSAKRRVILTRQFRMPVFSRGDEDGMLTEACAGVLEENDPEATIIREVEEETGFRIEKVQKVLESYMSPGSVTEILHFYLGEYRDTQRVSEGGGADSETEHIQVLEYSYEEALAMLANGEIRDAKTLILLQYAALNGILD